MTRPIKPAPIGQKFGRLTVVAEALPRYIAARNAFKRRVLCRCDCGNETEVSLYYLTSKGGSSCGCGRVGQKIHGHSRRSPTYQSWINMRARCYDPSTRAYKWYGAKGIKVCDEWMEPKTGFLNFLADMGERPNGLTLDRYRPEEDYSKANCRWATARVQYENKRVNRDASGKFTT